MEPRRKGLFHPHGRAAAPDIARHGQQLLHRDQVDLLVARDTGRGLQIDLVVSGHDTDEIARPVALEYQRLKNTLDRLPELCGHMRGREVRFIHLIRYEFVCDLRAVEQPRGICLFHLCVCHAAKVRFFPSRCTHFFRSGRRQKKRCEELQPALRTASFSASTAEPTARSHAGSGPATCGRPHRPT